MKDSEDNTTIQATNLDDLVKGYYQSKTMPEDKLSQMLKSDGKNSHTGQEIKNKNINLALAMVATMLIAVLVVQVFTWQRDIASLVFEEIAMNHNKHLEAEFTFDDYNVLSRAMTRLDFKLVAPESITKNYSLLGGRYCSIRGNLAAQLKVKDNLTNHVATLYITHLNDDLQAIANKSATIDSTRIQLWNAEGKFFGLAVDANTMGQ